MPTLEQNFDVNEYQLIVDSTISTQINWSATGDNHYIRLSVFNSNGNHVGSFISGSNVGTNDFETYLQPPLFQDHLNHLLVYP